MHINSKAMTLYTTIYHEAFLNYVENEYCAKHRHLPVIKPQRVLSSNLFPSAMAARSSQFSFSPLNLSSNDKEQVMLTAVADTVPKGSDRAASIVTAARLCLNTAVESQTY
jgi:hypothetical protein